MAYLSEVFILRNLIPIIISQTSHNVLPIKPASSQTGKPFITVANNSACANREIVNLLCFKND